MMAVVMFQEVTEVHQDLKVKFSHLVMSACEKYNMLRSDLPLRMS